MDRSGEVITIQQLNTGVIDVQKINLQVEILGCKGEKHFFLKKMWDEVVGWAIYRWAVYRCNDR